MQIKEFYPDSIENFIELTLKYFNDGSIRLYRGQDKDWPLEPTLMRLSKKLNMGTKILEDKLLAQFEKQAFAYDTNIIHYDKLEKISLAQHYGLPTRLLDWTSNPLNALWFACRSESFIKETSVVFGLVLTELDLMEINANHAFNNRFIRFFKPKEVNQRIEVQNSWFSIQPLKDFVPEFLQKGGDGLPHFDATENFNNKHFYTMAKFYIKPALKEEILSKLNLIGINYRSLFPDLQGVCKQIEWEFSKNSKSII